MYNNPARYTDPSGQEPWRVRRARRHATTYGVPWQVVAGVQDAEIALDTQFKDYIETAFWIAAVPAADLGFYQAGIAVQGVLAIKPDPGPGVGNVHVSTARTVSEYYATQYADEPSMQLGLHDLPDDELAHKLALPDVSTKVLAGYTRMLADYRFGSGGEPSLTDHSDLAQWTVTDGVAIWQGYRYGVEDISPRGQGFDLDIFQKRELSLDMTIQMAQGPGKDASMMGSVPYFEYYFGR